MGAIAGTAPAPGREPPNVWPRLVAGSLPRDTIHWPTIIIPTPRSRTNIDPYQDPLSEPPESQPPESQPPPLSQLPESQPPPLSQLPESEPPDPESQPPPSQDPEPPESQTTPPGPPTQEPDMLHAPHTKVRMPKRVRIHPRVVRLRRFTRAAPEIAGDCRPLRRGQPSAIGAGPIGRNELRPYLFPAL